MALGDSISFGYSEQKYNENYPTESPSRFEEGFDNFFNKDLKKTYKGITIENLACPGETSNGLIGEDRRLSAAKNRQKKPRRLRCIRVSATGTRVPTTTSTASRCTPGSARSPSSKTPSAS